MKNNAYNKVYLSLKDEILSWYIYIYIHILFNNYNNEEGEFVVWMSSVEMLRSVNCEKSYEAFSNKLIVD